LNFETGSYPGYSSACGGLGMEVHYRYTHTKCFRVGKFRGIKSLLGKWRWGVQVSRIFRGGGLFGCWYRRKKLVLLLESKLIEMVKKFKLLNINNLKLTDFVI